jgi:hypothetical protein
MAEEGSAAAEELLEEVNREMRRSAWVRERASRPPMAVMALGVPGGRDPPQQLPIPYPRWGVRPEEQLVRFNSRIDPLRSIPPAQVQEISAAVSLTRLRTSEVERSLQVLAAAGDLVVEPEEAKWRWNRHHGDGR